jgi:hypothetical protein
LALSGHRNRAAECPLSGGKADIGAKLLTKDETQRIAANIVKLPELLQRRQ